MKERPILFSGPMVRAILDGRKTQTRRVVKATHLSPLLKRHNLDVCRREWGDSQTVEIAVRDIRREALLGACPYGVPGDRLWVRETFALESCREVGWYEPPHRDGRPLRVREDDAWGRWWEQPHYRATDPAPDLVVAGRDGDEEPGVRWKPSIHMPRWASRLTLEVTGVRVERVKDIGNLDALAEGFGRHECGDCDGSGLAEGCVDPCPACAGDGWFCETDNFLRAFFDLNQRAPKGTNPWVWVVEFRRVTP